MCKIYSLIPVENMTFFPPLTICIIFFILHNNFKKKRSTSFWRGILQFTSFVFTVIFTNSIMINEYLSLFFLTILFHTCVHGTTIFIEDECIWREQSKLIDCDKKSFQSLQFRRSHPGYATLSIKETPLKQLDFNISHLPDLEIIDARRTKLNCRKINLRILEIVERIIVDQRTCLNSICCRKLQTLSNYDRNTKGNHEEAMSSPAALINLNHSEQFQSEEPLNVDVTSGIQSKNDTKSAYNIIRHEIQVNGVESKSNRNSISISTEIKINYDKAVAVPHPAGTGTGILIPKWT
ncbi:uncharacterized protein LOC115218622 isoform X2 [Octopus sinensis]|uniref:Uncharacterized protein LOC115218622 isoform X2 n=1 Tax=Octopus sinensis TaxID=2607531 RepID=A0A7E6F960_9MOLL|nr:uncharacterized protein LOC115218622 isoform X2 [Octopus sinensis]